MKKLSEGTEMKTDRIRGRCEFINVDANSTLLLMTFPVAPLLLCVVSVFPIIFRKIHGSYSRSQDVVHSTDRTELGKKCTRTKEEDDTDRVYLSSVSKLKHCSDDDDDDYVAVAEGRRVSST